MATKETTELTNESMELASKMGARLFKNVRGLFKSLDGIRKILAGLLTPGASDLIGFKTVIITPEMVGQKIAVFTAIEIKSKSDTVKKQQREFIEFVRAGGGIAGVSRSLEDTKKILN
jgi:hypothetical protein